MQAAWWTGSTGSRALWLGEDGLPAFAGLRGELLEQARRWRVIERHGFEDDTVLVLSRH
jgi:hypothetical protein